MSDSYESTGQELVKRIKALIPNNTHILTMTECWDLFKVPGFKCDDLDVTMAMADAALSIAKRQYTQELKP
jgi:hypothetical protein